MGLRIVLNAQVGICWIELLINVLNNVQLEHIWMLTSNVKDVHRLVYYAQTQLNAYLANLHLFFSMANAYPHARQVILKSKIH